MNPFEQLQHRAQRRAEQKASQAMTGCFITAFGVGLAGCILSGVGGYVAWQLYRASSDPWAGGIGNIEATAIWDGTGPLVCAGNQVLDVTPVTATLGASPAISAMGNCRMTLHGVNVSAPIALQVGGNAEVILDGGSYTGATAAIVAGASSHVVVQGAVIQGAVQRTGGARVEGM
ncbi:hypothetical protein [Sandaracinus amylolyticus]|uniref:Uncharacterized protein n=1 Tax=Sandaracinus amylolyticus TaxID=927083 RepID=A0A0F6YMR2_9BACT|nr:hypothetical protein [Sandaracinus amylolyticus]AKF10603.1 hypothetical protein DB32_007752 [Sandaracinus amylolyticus]